MSAPITKAEVEAALKQSEGVNALLERLLWEMEKENPISSSPSPTLPVVPPPPQPMPLAGLIKPEAFWDYVRGDVGELFPSITQSQVDGINATLNVAAGKLPLSWCAYCLATEYHETGKRMVGVKEGFDVSDEWRRRNLRYFPWYGRGKVQLTWETNYKKATQRLKELGYNIDLVANPDLALDNQIGALILVHGMIEGWFTDKTLRMYIPANPEKKHYIAARKIVNAMDRAELIAGYAVEFEKGLRLGDWR